MPTPRSQPPPMTARGMPDLLTAAVHWATQYGNMWGYDEAAGWRQWTGTHWVLVPRPSTLLDQQAITVLTDLSMPIQSDSRLDSLARLAATQCVRSFDSFPGRISFANGTLDSSTLTFGPHDPNDQLTTCLPYGYAPTGGFGAIDAFLEATIPDPYARIAYMVHIGLALLGDTRLHRSLLLLGPPRSGKTTLLALANATVGTELFAFAGASLFDRASEGLFSRASWSGKPLVCLDELPVESLRSEETFKQMAAHSGVSQRQMWTRETTSNVWRPKLLMATNEAPQYHDRSGALTERLLMIDCPHRRPEDARDIYLLDRLLPERGAFAPACIRMALVTLQLMVYPESAAMRTLRTSIELAGDTLKTWCQEECVCEPGVWTASKDLYDSYTAYCSTYGQRSPIAFERFTAALVERDSTLMPQRARYLDVLSGTRRQVRGILGIRLRTDADAEPLDSVPSGNGMVQPAPGAPDIDAWLP
jgi:putative DNA primase/helicase